MASSAAIDSRSDGCDHTDQVREVLAHLSDRRFSPQPETLVEGEWFLAQSGGLTGELSGGSPGEVIWVD